MIDYHIHSFFSPDSSESLQEIVRIATEKGLAAIAITDHIDLDTSPWEASMSFEMYFEAVEELRLMNPQIYIAIGIEAGYAKTSEAVYSHLFKKYPFDYIINSVHNYDGSTPLDYFNTVLQSLNAPYYYSSLGHLGLPARYYSGFSYDGCDEVIEQILLTLIKKERILEVNTSVDGAKCPFLPLPRILERYKELGGELITIGSDAHRAKDVGRSFDRCIERLRSMGFKAISFEKSRKIEQIPL